MKLAVWSPLPPSPSGIADYVAEQLPALAARAEVLCVVEDPASVDPRVAAAARLVRPADVPPVDLHLYHLGNSPAHGYVYRAACAVPGVAVLHEWNLHHLVLHETLERGDRQAYFREIRRSWGDKGTFVGHQVARGLGGELLPALFALNDSVLRNSLAVVGLTEYTCSRAELALWGRPVLHLRHHVSLPEGLPTREEARRALGLPDSAFVLCAPGLATAHKRLDVALRAVGRLRDRHPQVVLVVAGGVDPALPLAAWSEEASMGDALRVTGRLELADFIRHLVAADAVLCLRFPTYGETSGALLRSLGLGRPVIVTAGTPLCDEFPPGVVVPIAPGAREDAEMDAFLDLLIDNPGTRERIGGVACDYVRDEHDLGKSVARLVAFLGEVAGRRSELEAVVASRQVPEGSLRGYLLDEARFAALDLGLPGLPAEVGDILDMER